MERLTVIYAADSGYAVRCRLWLERQPCSAVLHFLEAPRPAVETTGADTKALGETTTEAIIPEAIIQAEWQVLNNTGQRLRGAAAWWAILQHLPAAAPALERLDVARFLPVARCLFFLQMENPRRLRELIKRLPPKALLQWLSEQVLPGENLPKRPQQGRSPNTDLSQLERTA